MAKKQKQDKFIEPYLHVYLDRSVLMEEKGVYIFKEGRPNESAFKRLETIRKALDKGFLVEIIKACKKPSKRAQDLSDEQMSLIRVLVDSLTSEVGRALVGLTILQLCVKAICPSQSIRLHKGGHAEFSWEDGIPMRVLDKNYITPVLRQNSLLSLNADGFMMTRSLAENYPYTKLYKAALRGARDEWLKLVDQIETQQLNPKAGLVFLISQLLTRSEKFLGIAKNTITYIKRYIDKKPEQNQVIEFIQEYIRESDHSARLFEVALHSLFQVLEDNALLVGTLKPLSQMRSANKKHGNVGDIEVTIPGSQLEILEAWDAKYGKQYLRDELEELNEKLKDHSETKIAGFVVDKAPDFKKEILERIADISQIHQVDISIHEFSEWTRFQLNKSGGKKDKLAREWLLAFAESLSQMRRARAPIDEPSDLWVQELGTHANRKLKAEG